MSLLSVRALSVAFGDRTLFSGVSLELEASEIVGLEAPSGSGKTSLLRAIAGLITPRSGEVHLEERSPEEIGWPLFRRQVCFVHQTPQLRDSTVRENLERPFMLAVSSRTFDQARAEEMLASLGLAGRLDEAARTLSAGERQRVALCRALMIRPRVLLLDEPTSALDPETKQKAESLITEYVQNSQGAAFVISHEDAQRDRWCQRTLRLEREGVRE